MSKKMEFTMKVASSQLNFSGGHTLRIRQEQHALLQRSTSSTSAEPTPNGSTPSATQVTRSGQLAVREQVTLNSQQRYQINSQSYVTNPNNDDDNAVFTSEKIIERTLSKAFTQNIRMDLSQITVLEPASDIQAGNTIQAEVTIGQQSIYEEEEHTNFSISGKVTMIDGKSVEFTLSAQLDRNFSLQKDARILSQNTQKTDPLAINLDGGIVTLRDSSFQFDLDADGTKENISFVSKGNGFIVFDKNNDGKINDGNEMFGTQSGNGFQDLSQYDDDNNGVIDENDSIYEQLEIWTQDGAGNDHLMSLKDAGVGVIGLEHDDTTFELKDDYNNSLGSIQRSGYFLMENGEAGFVQQVDLSQRNLDMEDKIKKQFEPTFPGLEFSELDIGLANLPGRRETSQAEPMLSLEQATILTKQTNDELLAKYDEVSSIEKSEEIKSLLEELVEELEQYGVEQKDIQDKENKET
ncbi:hypothetical protein A9Q81_19845 [Gammaproteobacteria bacterium 42_54_T18]|nr:hypothetical protein A9Q81_19845 [Gammaproteobacteria bacterium 42_54_T18]